MTAGPGPPDLVVAVDIGTTGVEAAVPDVAAITHADADARTRPRSPRPGRAVQDPDTVVDADGPWSRTGYTPDGRAGCTSQPAADAGVAAGSRMEEAEVCDE